MSMTLEEFKKVFSAYIKGTPDADIEALVEDGLNKRFPRLDQKHQPNRQMLADVLYETAKGLAEKLVVSQVVV